jgi:hypothetical protein
MSVANQPLNSLDFVPGGTAFVDITLTGDRVQLSRWLFLSAPSLSDHPYLYFDVVIPTFTRKPHRGSQRPVPSPPQIDRELFKAKLSNSLCFLPRTPLLTSSAVEDYIATISSAIADCAHASKIKLPRPSTVKKMSWWSEELRSLRSKARSHHKAWSKGKTEQSALLYKRSKADYQRALRAAKCKSWTAFRAKATTGDSFKALESFTGKSNSIPLPHILSVNGAPTSDPGAILEACANHFFPTEPPSDDSHNVIEEQARLATECVDSALTPALSNWEFESAIASLNPNSAPGADGISASLLTLCIPLIKPYLLLILNACLALCFFPDVWKISKVVVIGKPNKLDYSTLNSFRPISLVGNLSKILEKIILGRLSWFAQNLEWLSHNQHGFRESHSTETAAHSLTSFIESAFLERKTCAAAFLDIKSAFDSAWHPAIIAALSKRSCPVYLTKTVSSFLSNRKAIFSIGDEPYVKMVHIGCPQGGVLSPFLWNLLVDDLLRTVFPFPVKFVAYADDITVATSHKDPAIATRNLQLVCNVVETWLNGKKLFLNAIKTVFVLFSRKHSSLTHLFLVINGVKILSSLEVSFLGFLLDANLSWRGHLDAKCVSARRALLAINGCVRQYFGKDPSRLRFLYSSVVEPIVTYGCSVWISIVKKKAGQKKLRSLQRSVARMITCAFKTAPTDSIILISNLLPLDLRVIEIAAHRLLSSQNDHSFASSSRATIASLLPFLNSSHKLEPVFRARLALHPPWFLSSRVTILPPTLLSLDPCCPGTLKLFVQNHHNNLSAGFAVVTLDHSGIRDIVSSSLSSTASHRQVACFSLSKALDIVERTTSLFSSFEIYLTERYFIYAPGSKLTEAELDNFAKIASMGPKIYFFLAANPTSPAILLARFWSRSSNTMSDFPKNSPQHPKGLIKTHLVANWNREWINSKTGESTREFFPSVHSFRALLKLKTNALTTQMITGHCLLNQHQHRFGLSPSPACNCGSPVESVSHFILFCPIYSSYRRPLINAAENLKIPWPPPLSVFPKHALLWNTLVVFLKRTSRLKFPPPRH